MTHSGQGDAFAERDVMEYRPGSGSTSFRFDVEGPNDVQPLLGAIGNELAKVGGREREHVATQVGKPRLDLGIGKARVDLLVELVDDLGERLLRRANALERAGLVEGHRRRRAAEYTPKTRCL